MTHRPLVTVFPQRDGWNHAGSAFYPTILGSRGKGIQDTITHLCKDTGLTMRDQLEAYLHLAPERPKMPLIQRNFPADCGRPRPLR